LFDKGGLCIPKIRIAYSDRDVNLACPSIRACAAVVRVVSRNDGQGKGQQVPSALSRINLRAADAASDRCAGMSSNLKTTVKEQIDAEIGRNARVLLSGSRTK
jgi:hypothetical protein